MSTASGHQKDPAAQRPPPGRRLRAGFAPGKQWGLRVGWGGLVSSHPEGLRGGELGPRVGDAETVPQGEVL